ncbi:MAG: preprotein translocase subunit YajC [Deltaproteobacteria bacterium]|nr:preprotein translocase subunit YajC [Deltaproteobacteria bacterium]
MTLVNLINFVTLAQAAGNSATKGGPFDGLVTIGGPILMFVVIYLLLIRPAGKQRREHQAMLNKLEAGIEVITTGGLIGKIVRIEDRIVTLEVADKVKIRLLRDRIAGRFASPTAAAAQKS